MAVLVWATDKKGKEIKYDTKAKMHKVITYINKTEKTSPELQGGRYINDYNNTYEEMMLTKKVWGKIKGRMCFHYVQSFAPGESNPEQVKEIAERFLQHEKFKGFQIQYAVHTDKDFLHTHYIVNSVSVENGYMWQMAPSEWKSLQDYSDDLCREYGLSVIQREEKKNQKRKSITQQKAEEQGKSWKKETQLSVDEALKIATNRADFISIMSKQGYQVEWLDGSKYVTFTNRNNQAVRNKRFDNPEKYTKEEMIKKFKENSKEQNRKYKDKGDFSDIRKITFFDVRDALEIATGKDEFISILNAQGYQVTWDDRHKYVTFKKDGHQAVRNRNFYPGEKYTKEDMLKKFKANMKKEEEIKSGKYRDVAADTGEQRRGDLLYLLTSILRLSNPNDNYPHQTNQRNHSAEAIRDYMAEAEKGKGIDWEQS